MMSRNEKIIAPLKAIEIQTATEHLRKSSRTLFIKAEGSSQ